MIEGCEGRFFELTHVYGLTEVYGPAVRAPSIQSGTRWTARGARRLNGRQGVRYRLHAEAIAVLTGNHAARARRRRDHGRDHVPRQRGDEGLPEEPQGHRRGPLPAAGSTGDLAVMHPDGYVKIKDRSKDIIISGGENISSIEVEDVLYRHPAVMAAAVVALPDPKWGEVPCAFVES